MSVLPSLFEVDSTDTVHVPPSNSAQTQTSVKQMTCPAVAAVLIFQLLFSGRCHTRGDIMWKVGQRVWHAIRHPLGGGKNNTAPTAALEGSQPTPGSDSAHVSEAAQSDAPAPAQQNANTPAPAAAPGTRSAAHGSTPAPAVAVPTKRRTDASRPTIGILVEECPGERKWVQSGTSVMGNSGYYTTCSAPNYVRLYAEAVENAGGNVAWIHPNGGDPAAQLNGLHGILIPGGRDIHPEFYNQKEDRGANLNLGSKNFDRFELDVIRAAIGTPMPVRGICRGQQLMNIAQGGTLMQDIGNTLNVGYPYSLAHRDNQHPVHIVPSSRLAQIMEKDSIGVNSSHHQAIAAVAPGFFVTARAADGIIEGIQMAGRSNVLGVQFHPEKSTNEQGVTEKYFRSLVRDARDYWDEFDPLPADATEEKTSRTYAGEANSSKSSGSTNSGSGSSAPASSGSRPASSGSSSGSTPSAASRPSAASSAPPDFSKFSDDPYKAKLYEGFYYMGVAGHVITSTFGERFTMSRLNDMLKEEGGRWEVKHDASDLRSEMKVERSNLEDFLLSWAPDGPEHMKNQELADVVRGLRFLRSQKNMHLYRRNMFHNTQLNVIQAAWRLQNKEDVRISSAPDDNPPDHKVHNFEELKQLVTSMQPPPPPPPAEPAAEQPAQPPAADTTPKDATQPAESST